MTRLLTHIIIASVLSLPLHAAVVAYWNFNTLSISSAATPGSPGVPTSMAADQGSGTVNLSSWLGTVDDFGGSTLNTLGSDPAGPSLSLIAGSGTAGNGSSITLNLSMTGRADPVLSFATQRTLTGFDTNQLAYSTNGTDFTDFGSPFTPATSYAIQSFDLSAIDSLDGAPDVTLRITFSGATGTSGNNRLDNIQVSAVPEPSIPVIGMLGLLPALRRRRCH